jgi:glutamine amidotransferase
MCRIFGFRSVMQSQVHRSLVSADNAFMRQSERHPDGWGVAYYVADAPHVVKGASAAFGDQLFKHVSGIVTSETVLAHLRKATQGELSTINTHPFQYGHWVFAHNGNIANFAEMRDVLLSRIPPVLRRFILGTHRQRGPVLSDARQDGPALRAAPPRLSARSIAASVRETVAEISALAGPICEDSDGPPNLTYLTFVLTNGHAMLAHQGGKGCTSAPTSAAAPSARPARTSPRVRDARGARLHQPPRALQRTTRRRQRVGRAAPP